MQTITINAVTFGGTANPDKIVITYTGAEGTQTLEFPNKDALKEYANTNPIAVSAEDVFKFALQREIQRDADLPNLETLAGKQVSALDAIVTIG